MNLLDLWNRHQTFIRSLIPPIDQLKDYDYPPPPEAERQLTSILEALDQREDWGLDPAHQDLRRAWLTAMEYQLRLKLGIIEPIMAAQLEKSASDALPSMMSGIHATLLEWFRSEIEDPTLEPPTAMEWAQKVIDVLWNRVLPVSETTSSHALILKDNVKAYVTSLLENPTALLKSIPLLSDNRGDLRNVLRRCLNLRGLFAQRLPLDDMEPLDLGVKLHAGPFFLLRLLQHPERELTNELLTALAFQAQFHPSLPVVVAFPENYDPQIPIQLKDHGLTPWILSEEGVLFPPDEIFNIAEDQFIDASRITLPPLPDNSELDLKYGQRLAGISGEDSLWLVMKLQAEILKEAGMTMDPLHWHLTRELVRSEWRFHGSPQDYFNTLWLSVGKEWLEEKGWKLANRNGTYLTIE